MIAKRIFVLLLAVGLAAFMFGCGGKAAMEEVPTETEPPPQIEEPVEEPVVEVEPVEVTPPALNDVFFSFDKYNLTNESKSILETNAQELNRASDFNITIEGHCDERGTKSYNIALGEKRANAAKDYLVALGVRSSRITTISFGKERPFNMGHDEAAWAKNRRAHVVIKK